MDQLWRPGKAKQYKNKQNLGGPGEGQKAQTWGLGKAPRNGEINLGLGLAQIWGLEKAKRPEFGDLEITKKDKHQTLVAWTKLGAWKSPKQDNTFKFGSSTWKGANKSKGANN